jgi:YihY family inner membrane protein
MSSRVRQASSSFVGLISETYGEWRMHRTIRLGAGLAYYGLFAFVPMLAVSLSLAGFFFQRQDVQEYLAGQLADILGDDAPAASSALAGVLDEFDSLLSFGVVDAVSLVLTASLLVLALQDALNTIWERPVRSGLRTTVARRALAFLVVVGAGGVLMVSFALNAVSALFGRMVPDVAVMESVGELIGTAGSWALGVGVIALLFRYLTEGFLRQESQLEVTPSLERIPEMPWLILFGWYLVVMMHEDSAATAAVVS